MVYMRDNLYIIGRGAIGKALENQIFTNGSETSIGFAGLFLVPTIFWIGFAKYGNS